MHFVGGFESGLCNATSVNHTEFDAVVRGTDCTLEISATGCNQWSNYSLLVGTSGTSDYSYGRIDIPGATANIQVLINIQFPNGVPATPTSIFRVDSDATLGVNAFQHVTFYINEVGQIVVWNGRVSSFPQSTGSVVISDKLWHRFSFGIFASSTPGIGKIDCIVDGVTAISLSPTNVMDNTAWYNHYIGVAVPEVNAPLRRYDSYVAESYTTALELYQVGAARFGSDVSKGWRPTGSNHYAILNTVPWEQTPATYLDSIVDAQEDQIGLSNAPPGSTYIAIQPLYRLATDATGTASSYIRSSSSDGAVYDFAYTASQWKTIFGAMQSTNPNGGGSWTTATINAAKLKLVHHTTAAAYVASALIYVVFKQDKRRVTEMLILLESAASAATRRATQIYAPFEYIASTTTRRATQLETNFEYAGSPTSRRATQVLPVLEYISPTTSRRNTRLQIHVEWVNATNRIISQLIAELEYRINATTRAATTVEVGVENLPTSTTREVTEILTNIENLQQVTTRSATQLQEIVEFINSNTTRLATQIFIGTEYYIPVTFRYLTQLQTDLEYNIGQLYRATRVLVMLEYFSVTRRYATSILAMIEYIPPTLIIQGPLLQVV